MKCYRIASTLDVYQKVYPSVRASVCMSYMVLVDDIWMS